MHSSNERGLEVVRHADSASVAINDQAALAYAPASRQWFQQADGPAPDKTVLPQLELFDSAQSNPAPLDFSPTGSGGDNSPDITTLAREASQLAASGEVSEELPAIGEISGRLNAVEAGANGPRSSKGRSGQFGLGQAESEINVAVEDSREKELVSN